MKQIASAALCALLVAAPIQAQDDNDVSEGLNLLEEGSRMLLRGLLNEMEPAMEEMSDELRRALGNLSAYHPPEILPNGDIIIRRKVPLEPDGQDEDMPEVGEGGEVEL